MELLGLLGSLLIETENGYVAKTAFSYRGRIFGRGSSVSLELLTGNPQLMLWGSLHNWSVYGYMTDELICIEEIRHEQP